MNSNRKNAVMAGVFYILATAAPISTYFFLGSLNSQDYLIQVSANENQVLGGMFLEIIWTLAVVGIPVMLFPILKKHNETLASWFFSLRFIEAISTFASSIILLSLLTLSQEFVESGAPDASYYQTFGTLLLAARDWTSQLGPGVVFTLSALVLNYLLYRSELVPRWLSGWGFIGAMLLFAAYMIGFFGIELVEILFFPIAVQEMVFAVWLIVKGFNSSALASKPVNIGTTG